MDDVREIVHVAISIMVLICHSYFAPATTKHSLGGSELCNDLNLPSNPLSDKESLLASRPLLLQSLLHPFNHTS